MGRTPVLAGLASLLGASHGRHAVAEMEPTGRCPACQVQADRESMLTETLVASLANERFREAYRESAGLCLPHLRLALDRADDEMVFAMLRDAAVAKQEGLLAELADVIRRHDYRFAAEPWGPERDAAARAVEHTIGAPGIGN